MRAIFLDRDGVIIRKAPEGEYITGWDEVDFLPGSVETIAAFCRLGYKVFVVTNQRGVATGKIQISKLAEIHTRMREVIALHGGTLAGIYCCPHDIPEACMCRKPKPGMLLQAAAEHQLSLPLCWMVGDALSDIAAGKNAGCKTALISRTKDTPQCDGKPDVLAISLEMAAKDIFRMEAQASRN